MTIVTALGTLIGSVGASWAAARKTASASIETRTQNSEGRMQSELVGQREQFTKQIEALNAKLDAAIAHLTQERNDLHKELIRVQAESVTMEEFRAYAAIDSEKRERLIQVIGELSGELRAAVRNSGRR